MAIATDDHTGCTPCPPARSRDHSHYAADDRCPGTTWNAGAPCLGGYNGTLCQSCALGFHLSHTESCDLCESAVAAHGWLLGLVCAALVLVWGYTTRLRRRSRIAAVTPGSETVSEDNPLGSMGEVAAQQLEEGAIVAVLDAGCRSQIRTPTSDQLRLAVRCAFQPFRIVITYIQVTTQIFANIRYRTASAR